MNNLLKNKLPLVSIITPCRNEEKHIGRCLDSIVAQDYPKDELEVMVVDGMSEDGTRKIVEEYAKQRQFIRLLDNPKRITPCAFNTGFQHATGSNVAIVGAHSYIPAHYPPLFVFYNTPQKQGIMTENLDKLIKYRFQQAQETLAVAGELFENNHYKDAVNRAYYAMFYCSLGLLAAKNLGSSKHSGVLSLFSRYFVKTGQISIETGRHLRRNVLSKAPVPSTFLKTRRLRAYPNNS